MCTMTTASSPHGPRLCLPNELLSELVSCLPMGFFVKATCKQISAPRNLGPLTLLQHRRVHSVVLDVYLDNARDKYEKAQRQKKGMTFVCRMCTNQQRVFATLDLLEVHLAEDHFQHLPFSCTLCRQLGIGGRFATELSALRHVTMMHGQQFQICDTFAISYHIHGDSESKRAKVRRALLEHLGICLVEQGGGAGFDNNPSTKTSCSHQSSNLKTNFWCRMCTEQQQRGFATLDLLEAHWAGDHFQHFPFMCTFCPQFEIFSTEYVAIQHIALEHRQQFEGGENINLSYYFHENNEGNCIKLGQALLDSLCLVEQRGGFDNKPLTKASSSHQSALNIDIQPIDGQQNMISGNARSNLVYFLIKVPNGAEIKIDCEKEGNKVCDLKEMVVQRSEIQLGDFALYLKSGYRLYPPKPLDFITCSSDPEHPTILELKYVAGKK